MLFCLYVSCIVNEFALLNICSFPKSSCFMKTVISILCLLRLLPSPHSPSILAPRMLRSSYILNVYSEDINTLKYWTPVLSLVLVLPTSYSLVCWRPWNLTQCSLNLSELQQWLREDTGSVLVSLLSQIQSPWDKRLQRAKIYSDSQFKEFQWSHT